MCQWFRDKNLIFFLTFLTLLSTLHSLTNSFGYYLLIHLIFLSSFSHGFFSIKVQSYYYINSNIISYRNFVYFLLKRGRMAKVVRTDSSEGKGRGEGI